MNDKTDNTEVKTAEELVKENDRAALDRMAEERGLEPSNYSNMEELAKAIEAVDTAKTNDDETADEADLDVDRVVEDDEVEEDSQIETGRNATFEAPEPDVSDVTEPEGKAPIENAREENAREMASVIDEAPDRDQVAKEAGVPRPGSMDAAKTGVQQDASGHAESVGRTNSDKSGTRA